MKQSIKRAIAMLLCLSIAAASLCSCSGSDSSSGNASSNSSEQDSSVTDSSVTDNSKEDDSKTEYDDFSDEKPPYSPSEVVYTTPEQKGIFSAGSGVYETEFELTLSGEGTILYTTDGSDPATSATAKEYSAPIKITDRSGDKNVIAAIDPVLFDGANVEPNSTRDGFVSTLSLPSDSDVDKCTVIRAVQKNADGSFGDTQTETYFVGSMYDHIDGIGESSYAWGDKLAVISICANYDDFFDSEKGIYVKGDIYENALKKHLADGGGLDVDSSRAMDANYKQKGREWEREISVNFFESDGGSTDCVLTQNCGVRIQGNYSRSDLQKGLRLFARSEYGDNNFRYEVFKGLTNDAGETLDKFKTLTLRAGGNCAFTTKYSDTYWQSLLTDMDCDMKVSRPCVVYLNGEYFGLYVLEEDYEDDYFEDHHGVNKDDVVLYKGDAEKYNIGYKLDLGELPEGESDVSYYFSDLYNFFNSHSDLRSDEDYEEFKLLVDTDSVRDYFAAQIWINNKWDWPGKNWSMWKTTTKDYSNEYNDGRWRLCYYDMEFGGVSGSSDAYTNTIKDDNYKKYGLLDTDTNNPAVLCYAYLMTNDSWREDFYSALRGLGEGAFGDVRAQNKLDIFKNAYAPLYDQFFSRYPGTGSADNSNYGGYASYQCISDFISLRSENVEKKIKWAGNTLEKMYG